MLALKTSAPCLQEPSDRTKWKAARKWVFVFAMLFLVACVVEGMARLAYRLMVGEYYVVAQHRLPAATLATQDAALDRAVQSQPLGVALSGAREITLHPFYGFQGGQQKRMSSPSIGGGAPMIALLGGSVAQESAPYLRTALSRELLNFGTDVPIVVNLSGWGYRQPQQLIVMADVLAQGGQFDAIVVLDGYNEAEGPATAVEAERHPFMPSFWRSLVSLTPDQHAIVRRIIALRAEQEALVIPYLRHSAVVGLVVRFLFDRHQRRIVVLHHELAAAGGPRDLQTHGPRVANSWYRANHIGRSREYLPERYGPSSWYRSSTLLAALAAKHGAQYLHFLQPNQYVEGSKPLSEDELSYHTPSTLVAGSVRHFYPLLARYGEELQEQGIKFFDLSQMFADHPETIYRDDCCHLNEHGYRLMAAAMARRIVAEMDESGRLGR